ncbi:MAG TPA: hypothetical protein VMU67_03170 [Steroidobacteraceae bacterium]|nr:hypothetical protein [Steroidobacteraceae bacterium]
MRISTPDLGRLIIAGTMRGVGLLAFNVVVNDQRMAASLTSAAPIATS